MKYSENVITFRTHVGSAMKDRISLDMLVKIMDDLCSTLDKSKEVNHILLDELKTYKNVCSTVLECDKAENGNIKEESDIKEEDTDPMEYVKSELYDADYVDDNSYPPDEDNNILDEENCEEHCVRTL